MLETLGELPLALRLLIAFAVVLVLMVVTFWVIRRFAGTRLGTVARGRQPRLAVIDAAAVDGRRRLVLIRRDNVEHLLLIGGPADVVVEQNIVRAVPVAPPREVPARPPAAETPARSELAPRSEPAPRPQFPSRPEPSVRPPEAIPAAPSLSRVREPLPRPERPARPPQRAEPQRAEPQRPEPRPPTPREEPAEMAPDFPQMPVRPGRPAERAVPPPSMRRAVEPPAEARFEADPKQTPAALDTSLNDIAQRLDAALRRPGAVTPRPAGAPSASEAASRPTPPPPPAAPPAPSTGAPPEPKTEPPAPDAPRAASPSPAQGTPAAAKPAAPPSPSPPAAAKPERPEERKRPGKTVYDSLEEEMASLLGRPTDKNQ